MSEKDFSKWNEIWRYSVDTRRDYDRRWLRWYRIVDDAMFGSSDNIGKAEYGVEVNELAAIIETVLPNIIIKPGEVMVRAIKAENKVIAAIYEYILKYILSHYGIKEQLEKSVFDTLLLGSGIVKIGYDLLPVVGESQWRSGISGTTRETAFALNTPLYEFYPDYNVNDWSLQRFCIHEVWKHIDEFKGNPLYNKTQVSKLKTGNVPIDDIFFNYKTSLFPKKDYVKIQEIHDFTTGKMRIASYTNGCNDFLYEGDEEFMMIPFEHLTFSFKPLAIWGASITQRIEQHMIELSKYHTALGRLLNKLGLNKWMFDSTKVKKDVINLLKSSSDEALPIVGPTDGVIQSLDMGLSNKQYNFDQAIALKQATIVDVSGVSKQDRGMAQPGVDTAFEVSELQNNSSVRMQARLQKFEDFVVRILEKMLYVITSVYDKSQISEMTGFDEQTLQYVLRDSYNPSKFKIQYGRSAVTDNTERLQKIDWLIQRFGTALNPTALLQMASDALDLEYDDDMIIQGVPIQPQAKGQQKSSVSTPGNRMPNAPT